MYGKMLLRAARPAAETEQEMKAVAIGIIVAVLAFGAWGAYTAVAQVKAAVAVHAEKAA